MSELPVALVHGFAASCATTWRDPGWFDLLADTGREVIGIDLLGHGSAPKPHDPRAYDGLEDHAAANLPAGPVDAVGFSLGARVLLVLAAREPQRFGRLVVAGVGASLFTEPDPTPIAVAIESEPAPDDRVGQHFAQLAHAPGNDPQALAACLRRNAPNITPDLLATVCQPVLVVLGDRDLAGPPDPLLDALGNAELATLRGVDHFATPRAFGFIDATLSFLA